MLDLRYSVGFWIFLFFKIYQSGEYNRVLNLSGLRKNLDKIFNDRCLTVIWICWFCWHYFDSEYARVLNMLGSHMILNKILHNRYLTGFGLECASSSEYASVTQGSIENGPSYSSGSQYARAWIGYTGCEYVKVTQGFV